MRSGARARFRPSARTKCRPTHAGMLTSTPSDHRIVEQWLDGAPFLAARALPMVAARSEATTTAAITRITHQQLVGDVLEVVQGRGRVRVVRQCQVDQCGFTSHRRPILQLLRKIGAGRGNAFLAFDQSGQRQHRRHATIVFAHLTQECTRAWRIANPFIAIQ